MGPNTLQAAEQAVGRLEARLDSKKLFGGSPERVGRNHLAHLVPLVALGLDGLAGGHRVPREEFCKN